MDNLFLTILNMSLTGAFVIGVICLARLPLKKAPKFISYCLWFVAGLRLMLPFSVESVFAIIPFNANPVIVDSAVQSTTMPVLPNALSDGYVIINRVPVVENMFPTLPSYSAAIESVDSAIYNTTNLFHNVNFVMIAAFVWGAVAMIMLIHGIVSYITLKRKMGNAVHVEGNIYESKNAISPFVLGVFNPMIYLPQGLSEQERKYIILHEKIHIRRFDHIARIMAYIILCLHWFNPFVWVGFILMGRDMEMACDERVLQEMGNKIKAAYSMSLVTLVTERRFINAYPPAFGEGNIKERVKNVVNFKKASRVLVAVAIIFVVALSGVLMFDRISSSADDVSAIDDYAGLSTPDYYEVYQNQVEPSEPLEHVIIQIPNNNSDLLTHTREVTNNNDLIAWISIPGTRIDYVVAQTIDNYFYLTHDFRGNRNAMGTLFLDLRNASDFSDQNSLIYGHNMINGMKLHNLRYFVSSRDFFNQNRYIHIYLENELLVYEIFTAFITHISFDYLMIDFEFGEFVPFAEELSQRSLHDSGISIGEDDRILILSTCTPEGDDYRIVVAGRLIQ